ncbi:hypothetical protein PVL29_016920 [Vitis rotundifolia]|uniref:KOW domain-containing protein n=1 Tax=Vitis rotundifolia TaxID=103349 RepID=A0AA38Z938_VITRO|nr:hypothetical protein PVL29_016920 [Vitis rotundifolia]
MSYKGKEIAGKGSSGKRKRDDDDKSGRRKRKNSAVLQFFEDAAEVDNDSSDDSISGDDFLEDEFNTGLIVKNEPGKAHNLPFFPKEEELSEEELEKMLEERYKDGSKFVTYAEDDYETKRSVQRNSLIPSIKDPTIWKVKCMVGRERLSAFCLMQKYIDLQSLGTKLQIISAFSVEHVKGFIYIEADKQCDINEACKGLCSIYTSRVAPVPKNEVTHLLSVRSKCNEISEGTWARMKNGKYKGDLAQIVVVSDAQKKATVKLIPRIDLQAMAEKFGGGVSAKKRNNPAPRLISSSELEEFRPLIQYRRDRDTGKLFEILDGQMLKDGYLYKKVSIDSLSCWGVTPSEEELHKFTPSSNEESVDLEWLSQLYGERKQKRTTKSDKGGEKGEGSSGSSMVNSFELHDLVCFGRKDFGIVIGMEKDENYKILKDGPEGPVVQTVELHELKNPLFENKFTALDQHMKTISINDTLKVLEGPLKGRQGLVKKIYRGVIFLYDENEMENNGYFCSKSQMCEKIKLCGDACNEKVVTHNLALAGPSGFEDFPSSPKSPLSPKKPWLARENNRDFNRGDKDGMFSVGQALRIRVGPLKGYLCRVLAIRYSDVTVKLDSQHKVLTVKCEHLSEVRGKGFSVSTSDNPESSSLKSFGLLGTQDSARDWVDGAGTAAESDRWNTGETSAERSSWPSFPASNFSLQPESNSANPFGSVDNDSKKDMGDASWEIKPTPNQNSSWGAATTSKTVADSDQVGGWGKSENCWNKSATTGFGSSAADGWEKAKLSNVDQAGSSKGAGNNWGDKTVVDSDQGGSWGKGENCWDKSAATTSFGSSATDNWGKAKPSSGDQAGSSKGAGGNWDDKIVADGDQLGGWGKSENCWNRSAVTTGFGSSASDSWEKSKVSGSNQAGSLKDAGDNWDKGKNVSGTRSNGWNDATTGNDQLDSWGKGKNVGEASCWEKSKSPSIGEDRWNNGGSGWNQQKSGDKREDTGGGDGSTWGKALESQEKGSGSSASKVDWKSSVARPENQTGGWGQQGGVGEDESGWRKGGLSSQDQTGSWNKPKTFDVTRGSAWNQQADGTNEDFKGGSDQNGSWGKPNGFSGDREFDRGNGSGGRWGRGGHQGGRDQFGRGRSFGRGQSSGWNKESQESTWTGDGAYSGNQSSWSHDRASGRGKGKTFDEGRKDGGWKRENASHEDNGSSWSKKWGGGKETSESGEKHSKSSDWSNPNASNKDMSSGWNNKFNANEETGGTGGHDGGWNKRKAPSEHQKTPWKTNESNLDGNPSGFQGQDGWGTPKPPQDKSSGWNHKSIDNEKDGDGKDQGDGWNSRKTSDGSSASRWGQSSGWKNGISSDAGGNQDSDWGRKSNWNSGGGNEYENDTSDNRERGGNWRGGRGNSGRGGFGGRGGSDRGGFGGRGGSDRGGFGGRGGSDRGGFRGRGRSDRGGFGGRGRSDRGGFGGGGDSDRGGFGGRGRGRRDQSGGWNNRNNSGENNKSFEWIKGSNNNGEGWKGHDGAVSWGQGGGDKGPRNWNSGTGGTSNQYGGWNSEGSGWNQSKGVVESSGTGSQAGSWNKGASPAKDYGGSRVEASNLNSQSSGWNKGSAQTSGAVVSNDQGNDWKQSNASGKGQWSAGNQSIAGAQAEAWDKQGSGWNRGTSAGSGSMTRDGAETWNQLKAPDGAQSSAWNQTKNSKEGTSNFREATDSWGKAAANSWGKEKDGSSKGGW